MKVQQKYERESINLELFAAGASEEEILRWFQSWQQWIDFT